MCNCTCDCSELEDDLDAMEDKVEEAEPKKVDYQNLLSAQEDYTESIFDMANSVSEYIEFDDIDDLVDFTLDFADLVKKIAQLIGLVAAVKVVSYIVCVLTYYIFTAAASIAFEEIYRNRFNYWSNELEERKKKYDEIEDKLDDCYSSLTKCKACAEEFVDKEECGRECEGCGRWYCINCFDESIESAELAAGEAF